MYVCMYVCHTLIIAWAVYTFYVGDAVSVYIASCSSFARGHMFWWRWSLNQSNLSLKGVLIDYEKESKGPLPPKKAKLKSGKLTEKGRNNVDSRNLASTGRAIFQAARGILLRTLRIPSR